MGDFQFTCISYNYYNTIFGIENNTLMVAGKMCKGFVLVDMAKVEAVDTPDSVDTVGATNTRVARAVVLGAEPNNPAYICDDKRS